MEDGGHQPRPLRIVKRPLSAADRTSGSGTQRNSPGPGSNQVRGMSVGTDASMGSIREVSGATHHALTIPKKRRTFPSRLDGGAGRFNTASAASTAAAARRRLNFTDSFDSGSENEDLSSSVDGPHGTFAGNGEIEDGNRYASIRSQFLRDARRSLNVYGMDSVDQQSRPLSEHRNIRRFEEERNEETYPMHSDPFRETGDSHWRPEGPDEFRRQAGISTLTSDRRAPYEWPAALSRPPQSPEYNRPVSSAALPAGPDLFFPDPYERAATAIPFESRHERHPQLQSHHLGQPHGHFDWPYLDRLSLTGSGNAPEADPQILVPIVSVTPEFRTVEGHVNSFWVAIELFAQLAQPLDTVRSRSHRIRQDSRHASTTFSAMDDQGLSRFGYISSMDIKIIPSFQSEILEVIGKSSSLITLLPGSRRLMIVHVHLDTTKHRPEYKSQEHRPLSHNNKSDKLMKDLELQLGSTSQEYMQIQLTYSHSGFPKRNVGRDALGRDGECVEVRTTIETSVTALVMQHNFSSPWSPSPAPAGSPLVDIVAKHWGPSAAKEMAKRISTSIEMRMLRRTATPLAAWDTHRSQDQSHEERPGTPQTMALDGRPGEATPRARSHHQKQEKENEQQNEKRSEKATLHIQEQPQTMMRKLTNDGRQTSSTVERVASLSHKQVSLPQIQRLSLSSANIPKESDPPSPGCLLPRSKAVKSVIEGPRQLVPDAAPRNVRRPVGMDTTNLQHLIHGASDQNLKSENCDERRAAYGGLRNSSRNSTISKRSGKWSWSGWFS